MILEKELNISKYIQAIYDDQELDEKATEQEKQAVKFLLNNLTNDYHFWQQVEIKENANGSAH
jgi:hypothetical protein